MIFNSNEELKLFLKKLTFIGLGSEGTCYLNRENNTIIKIYHFFEESMENDEKIEFCEYKEEEILKYTNIINNTFIWPTSTVKVKNTIVGNITPFIRARNLYKINPLTIDLDRLCSAIIEARKDIKTISSKGIFTYDMMYNTLYNGKFYIIDSDEYFYSDNADLEKQNYNNLDFELYYFLIDSYFNKVIENNNLLNELYKEKKEDVLIFIQLFRKYLGELTGEQINYLNQAQKYIKHSRNKNYIYKRI